jgi:hypothetical protein
MAIQEFCNIVWNVKLHYHVMSPSLAILRFQVYKFGKEEKGGGYSVPLYDKNCMLPRLNTLWNVFKDSMMC